MNPEEHAELAGSSELPYFLIKKLPADLIIYLGNFMQSKDYLSFIRGLWPDHDEDELVQLALWKKTTHRLRSEFMYGKPLEIEYNYDHTRIDEERVLINVYTLLPVFGGMVPPDTETFANVKRLNAFVERHVRFNECQAYRYACCPCHLDIDPEVASEFEPHPENSCPDRHFHHFCSEHVNHWLSLVLEPLIKNLEEGSCNEESVLEFSDFLGSTIYFNNGETLFRAIRGFRELYELSQQYLRQ
ncbi:repeat element 28 [Diadegma semiclausum ichnovirus]|nr:repeat element 28 [Diadegma semiclausum ichnovirus]